MTATIRSFIGLLTPAFDSAEITRQSRIHRLGARRRVQRRSGRCDLFRADNIFDEEYEGALGYPGMPRTAMVGVRFDVGVGLVRRRPLDSCR